MVQIKVPVSGIDYNLRLFNRGCTHFVDIFYIVCHCQRHVRKELRVYEKSPERQQWKVCIFRKNPYPSCKTLML